MYKQLMSLILIPGLLILQGCAPLTQKVHHSISDAPKNKIPSKLIIMPPHIQILEVSAGGDTEEMPEKSEIANHNFRSIINSYAEKSSAIKLYNLPKLKNKKQGIIDEHIALYDIVGGSASMHVLHSNLYWQHKREHFDYTLGDGLHFLKKKQELQQHYS